MPTEYIGSNSNLTFIVKLEPHSRSSQVSSYKPVNTVYLAVNGAVIDILGLLKNQLSLR